MVHYLLCFAVSIFIMARIHGAGKKIGNWTWNLETYFFVTEETHYLTLSTRHRKEQPGEFGTYAPSSGPFHSSVRKDWQCETATTFLKRFSSTPHFTLWLNVIFWSFALHKFTYILMAGLNYSLPRAKGIFLTISLPADAIKIPEARKYLGPLE